MNHLLVLRGLRLIDLSKESIVSNLSLVCMYTS